MVVYLARALDLTRGPFKCLINQIHILLNDFGLIKSDGEVRSGVCKLDFETLIKLDDVLQVSILD